MSYQQDRITGIPAPLPKDYDRLFDFTGYEALFPNTPKPGDKLDAEFNAIQQALDETQARLRLVQRDDGALTNESVGIEQLKSDVQAGVNPPSDWAEFTQYTVRDTVIVGTGKWYVALESHVSSDDFDADQQAGKWRLLLDLTPYTANFYEYESFTATTGQDTFAVDYDPNFVRVFKNGLRLFPDEYDSSSGTEVVLNTPCAEDDEVIVEGFTSVVDSQAASNFEVTADGTADTRTLGVWMSAVLQVVSDNAAASAINWSWPYQVGNNLTISSVQVPALAALNGTDVAFIDRSNDELRVYRFDGTDFAQVGNSLSVTGAGLSALAALNGTDVAFIDRSNDELRVYRFDGTDFAQVGNSLSIPGSGAPALTALNDTDVALIDDGAITGDEELRVYRFDGTDFAQVGNSLSVTGAGFSALAALNGTDVAFIDRSNDELRVYRFDGTDFAQVGNSLSIPGSSYPALAALNGTDVAFIDDSNDELRVYRFDGTDFAQVGNSLSVSGVIRPALAALNGTDVAFIDEGNTEMRLYRHAYSVGPLPRNQQIVRG